MSNSSQPIKLPDAFFPTPVHNTDPLAPKLWPGISADAQSELPNLLRQNNEKWHIYFNDRAFHNHLTHHLFAAYAMGASSDVLKAAYKLHADYQRPAYKSRSPIDQSNWKDRLKNRDYYNAFMHFFASEIERIGASETLEKYGFSKEANLDAEGALGAQMLDRLMSGLVHPLIHAGHWAEFGVPGMLAEGLAMAAVTSAQSPQLFPPEFFDYRRDDHINSTQELTIGSARPKSPSPRGGGVHSLTLLARMLQDPKLAAGQVCEMDQDDTFTNTLKNAGDYIRSYTKQWHVDTPAEVPGKIEELAWLASLVYSLGGYRKGHSFRSDFFLLHLVTSSIFIPSLVSKLPFPAQSALLRAQLAIILSWWVSRGRPGIPISDFYAADVSALLPKALVVHPDKNAIGLDDKALPSNMWLPIIESSLNHPEEHLLKNQRSLAHFDRLYGTTPPGYFEGKTELEGAELLDGTLFWRVALHTQKTLGWMREGEPQGGFDRAGLGWDELWA